MQQPWSWRPFLCLTAEEDWLTESCRPIRQDVRRALFIYALFGDYFFVSDSFLLTHPEAAEMLLQEGSLLREMVATNHAMIVTTAVSKAEFVSRARGHSLENFWQRSISHLWPGSIGRLPRDDQEVGFSSTGPPPELEFREEADFDYLIGRHPDILLNSGQVNRRRVLQAQIGPYAPESALDFLSDALGTAFTPVAGDHGGQDMLSVKTPENEMLDQPFLFVSQDFFQRELSSLSRVSHPAERRFREMRAQYCGQMLRLIQKGGSKARQDLAALTAEYLLVLEKEITGPAVSGQIRTSDAGAGNGAWSSLTVREVLPAMISCASRAAQKESDSRREGNS